jgi:hypothetical protein
MESMFWMPLKKSTMGKILSLQFLMLGLNQVQNLNYIQLVSINTLNKGSKELSQLLLVEESQGLSTP